jgi:hypothetical protein
MGQTSEVDKIDEQIVELEKRLESGASHVATMDLIRQIDALKQKKEKMSKGWIIS